MKVIIVGCGRVGARLATLLGNEGHEICIVDRKKSALKRLGSSYKGGFVVGTGIDEDILIKAGVETADVLAAVSNGDNTNIMASQIAKSIFHVPKVVTRIYDPERSQFYQELGLSTFSTTVIGANVVREMIFKEAK